MDIPEVLDATGVIFYLTDSSNTVAGVSLLVPMSPTFGEPVSLCVNHRNTDLNALQDESEMEVVENGKHVIKKACIEKKLYKHKDLDYVGSTAGAQLYFSSTTLKKESPHSSIFIFATIIYLLAFYKHGCQLTSSRQKIALNDN